MPFSKGQAHAAATPALVSTTERATSPGVHIVPPLVARDTQVLEELLPPEAATDDVQGGESVVTLEGSSMGSREQQQKKQQRPVYHVSIPPRRPSPAHCECSRSLTRKFIQQLEPLLDTLIDVYLSKLGPCLPMLDAAALRKQLSNSPRDQSSAQTFLVTFGAYTLFHWNKRVSDSAHAPKDMTIPDQDFAWQVACSEMNNDTQSGGILSIIASVLNIAGRPSKGVIHNLTSVARIVALSNSTGLNHDCSQWKISREEKNIRWKLWWAVLIHDRWFNFAQGTPPLINADHYDVPQPSLSLLLGQETQLQTSLLSAQCYVAFCQLTEIAGEVLPLVYQVRSATVTITARQIQKSQMDLDAWVRNLPDSLSLIDVRTRPAVSGFVNMQMSYLAVQMLLRRLSWHENHRSETVENEEVLRQCQLVAQEICIILSSLGTSELAGFWLPYNAQHFTSAVTLLLRCALETNFPFTRTECMQSAHNLVENLERYQREYGWDIAEAVLNPSRKILSRTEEALPKLRTRSTLTGALELPTDGDEVAAQLLEATDENNIIDGWFDPIHQISLEELFPNIFSISSELPDFI